MVQYKQILALRYRNTVTNHARETIVLALIMSFVWVLSISFNWIFYSKQRWRMVWNLKQEKPQRQRHRSTHDVTESISTFSRRRNFVKISVKPRGLGLTFSHWWKVLCILTLGKVVYKVPSNTIYPWFLSKDKTQAGYLTPSPFMTLCLSLKRNSCGQLIRCMS